MLRRLLGALTISLAMIFGFALWLPIAMALFGAVISGFVYLIVWTYEDPTWEIIVLDVVVLVGLIAFFGSQRFRRGYAEFKRQILGNM